jgi:integrase
VAVLPRDNDNGARSKSREPRSIPVSAGLIRLYADYLHGEYGDLDCDYVFVNLWGQPRGHPLGYPAVYDLVRRLRRRTGIGFDPHWCRHTAATRMQRRGVASDATFRAGCGEAVAGAAALPGVWRARGPGAGHAADQGLLAPGCAG